MTTDQNVDIVRRGYELFGKRDIRALLDTFDERIEWRSPGPSDLPTAGVRRGRQEVERWLKALTDTFEIQRLQPETFVAQGDHVVVLGTDTSRIRATGKTLENESWAHVFTLKDGKVVKFDEYRDMSAAVAELHAAHVTRA